MDANSLAALATTTYIALQPYLPVLLTKAAEKIGEEVPPGIAKLWNGLRERFAHKPNAEESLKDLSTSPDDPDIQAAFRVQLRKLLEEDTGFADELNRLIDQAGAKTDYHAVLHGSGAIAQGIGATAIGAGGTMIHGEPKDKESD